MCQHVSRPGPLVVCRCRAKDGFGRTPLEAAVMQGEPATAGLLLEQLQPSEGPPGLLLLAAQAVRLVRQGSGAWDSGRAAGKAGVRWEGRRLLASVLTAGRPQ